MSECNNNVQKTGSSNPIQSKIIENDHGSGSASALGDNTLEEVTCDATVSIGSIVRLSGSTFINALANNFTNSKVVGICTAKSSSTICNIQVTGFTPSVLSGLTTNNLYFLSDSIPGTLTSTPPSTSGSYVIKIGTAYETNKLIIDIERIVKRA